MTFKRSVLELLLVISLLFQGTASIQVLEFQKDGVARLDSMAEYKGKLDHNWGMDSVTLCARFKIYFLHNRGTFFHLQDHTDGKENQLKGELWLNRVRPVIAERYKFQLLNEKLRPFKWYHICFTYDHLKHLYNTFINGQLVYEMTYDVGRQIYGDYARLGRAEPLYESFSGSLSQVNVWDSVISTTMIADMAACKIDPQGNYISWDAGWTLFTVTEYDVPLKHFCQQTTDTIYFGFPELRKDFAFYVCEALGSHLPLPATMNDIDFYRNLTQHAWPDRLDRCGDDFWGAIIDINDEGTWVTHYDNVVAPPAFWYDGEPNGITYENCVKFEASYGLQDVNCKTNELCAICEFPDLQIFSFLGTCELELRNIYFIAYQEELGDLHFKGYGEYHIRMEGDEWLWINVVKNKTLARLDPNAPFGMPMGRRVWHLETKVCDQPGGTRTLVLTPCQSDSYTCDDATCIPHENRCDLKYDCLDRSDEVDCELVGKPGDYKKDLPPRLGDDKEAASLPVTLKISIESAALDTTQMTMQLSFELEMSWSDNRLVFRNLKVNDSLNILPFTNMISLWSPNVGFVNTEGHQQTTVDMRSILLLQRQEPPAERDNSAPGEVDLFPGEENPLILSRKYSTTFICDFNLVLYPFDVQQCDMHLRMLSASKNYLIFDEIASSAAYYGSELLLEYQIEQPKLLYDNSRESSEMMARITLQRRSGYAILNIYTPSMILLVISYVSLFLRPHILEVRIMTTLTSMLVLATLFTQVSASLPKTSYFKMVDVWLLFCIVISFMIIIFHIIIDNALTDAAPGILDSSLPAPTKVLPLSVDSRPSSSALRNSAAGISKTAKGLIALSRYSIFAIFALFSLIYWSYIFG